MAAKQFIVFSLLVASVYGSSYSSFSYGVVDPNTGDIKDQHEKRVGDSVVGKYSLLESDGTKRIVEYEASAATGFNAVVRKEPSGEGQPSGPLGLEPLAGPANQSIAPAQPSPPAPAEVAPIISANATPIAPVGPPAHPEQMGQSVTLPLPVANPDLGGKPHPETLSAPGALPQPGPLFHPSSQIQSGTLPVKGASAPLPGTLIHQTPWVQSGAVSYQTVFAQHGFTPRDNLPYPDAKGPQTSHAGITNSRPLNPYVNPLSDNFIRPGYASFAGANGLGSPISGPQGVPTVSHFSNSIVHEAPRAYPGSHAFGYNGRPYGGSYGGYGGFGAYDQHSSLRAPLSRGPANFLTHGVGPHGVAHSYASLTRGEAYPHGYGGYGARGADNGASSADVGAGLPW